MERGTHQDLFLGTNTRIDHLSKAVGPLSAARGVEMPGSLGNPASFVMWSRSWELPWVLAVPLPGFRAGTFEVCSLLPALEGQGTEIRAGREGEGA